LFVALISGFQQRALEIGIHRNNGGEAKARDMYNNASENVDLTEDKIAELKFYDDRTYGVEIKIYNKIIEALEDQIAKDNEYLKL